MIIGYFFLGQTAIVDRYLTMFLSQRKVGHALVVPYHYFGSIYIFQYLELNRSGGS